MKKINGRLENKVVIVTGASKGIGAGIAKEMGASGAKVVVNYSSSEANARSVVGEITGMGGTAIAVQGDMSDSEAVKRLFDATANAFGHLDALINNAGIYEFAPLGSFSEAAYRKIFDVNVLGLLLTAQQAVESFGEQGGSIVNISSFASKRPEPFSLVYGASKGAVDTITIALSQELGPKNIRVNAIQPGGVFTEGVAKLGATVDSDAIKQMVSRSSLGRMATPEDIGQLAVFLASDESRLVTGQLIEVSGGFK